MDSPPHVDAILVCRSDSGTSSYIMQIVFQSLAASDSIPMATIAAYRVRASAMRPLLEWGWR